MDEKVRTIARRWKDNVDSNRPSASTIDEKKVRTMIMEERQL